MSKVIFACVHNAGRSQMAASSDRGRRHARGRNRSVRRTAAAADGGAHRGAAVLVTMGCGEECPFVSGARLVDWRLPDPAGRDLAAVRDIREEIRRRVIQLLEEEGWAAGEARSL